MTKLLGVLVVVGALVAVTGCARDERWTLDGSRPGPLDDRTGSEIAYFPDSQAYPRERHTSEEAMKRVRLVQENGVCKIRCGHAMWPITATVTVRPGVKNTPAERIRTLQVLVVPNGETVLGRLNAEGTSNVWSYRLLTAEFNRRR